MVFRLYTRSACLCSSLRQRSQLAPAHIRGSTLSRLQSSIAPPARLKGCVSTFGADQFDLSQAKMLSLYYTVFYFTINFGSAVSVYTSPLLRGLQSICSLACARDAPNCSSIVFRLSLLLSGGVWCASDSHYNLTDRFHRRQSCVKNNFEFIG